MKNCDTYIRVGGYGYGRTFSSIKKYIMALEEDDKQRKGGLRIFKDRIAEYNNPSNKLNRK